MLLKIERIEKDRTEKERYWVYLENGEKIAFYGDIIVKHNIKMGKEITQDQLENWQKEDETKKSFEMALNYLSYRPRSRKEMVDYLIGKKFDVNVVESTLDKLEKYGYIDDLSFSRGWVKGRMGGKPMGRRMIACELYQKGISKDVIHEALETVDEEEEEQAALELAKKYMKKYEKLQERERLYKVGQAMARRGFDWDLIQRICRKLNFEEGE